MTFIVFEGAECSGKTTHIISLYEFLINQGHQVIMTREPGGTPFAETIRELFKAKTEDEPLTITEILLITAARLEHCTKVINPALESGKIVLCDRFIDSTFVYQPLQATVRRITEVTFGRADEPFPEVDLVLNLIMSEKTLRKRLEKRSGNGDRFDEKLISFHERCNFFFSFMTKKDYPKKVFAHPFGLMPDRVAIDSDKPIDEVFEQIKQEVLKII
jgi:dTMP kinase